MELDQVGQVGNGISTALPNELSILFSDARDYLRKMREEQMRDGETAVRLWEEVLRDNAYKLGDERKNIQEDLLV